MMKSLNDADIEDKIVFLRVDWNVPLERGEILDDNRIRATIPTIEFLQSRNCKIIIGTHIGRPDGEVVPQLSTKILAKRFSEFSKEKVYATDYVIESAVKKQVNALRPKQILVLGNLRWYAEEEQNNFSFARILAGYADIYVNDAFAVSHRAHASVEAISNFLPSYAGLLLEKEVVTLATLTDSPRQPFVLVLGGAKIKEKVGVIKKFAAIADKILIGGAIANTLRYFNGQEVSASTFEANLADTVEQVSEIAKDKIVLPSDDKRKNLENNRFSILDIGPKTIEDFKKYISEAKTIFWNGNMGYSEDREFEDGTLEIAQAIRSNQFIKIIAGGDTVGFVNSHNINSGFTFISTGGGATLEFLAGVELPGLKVLGYYDKEMPKFE